MFRTKIIVNLINTLLKSNYCSTMIEYNTYFIGLSNGTRSPVEYGGLRRERDSSVKQ